VPGDLAGTAGTEVRSAACTRDCPKRCNLTTEAQRHYRKGQNILVVKAN